MHTLSRHIRARQWIRFLAAVTLAVLAVCAPPSAESLEVIVAREADLKPYQDASRGFKEACGCEVREIKLNDDDGIRKILHLSPDAVVANGTNVFNKIKSIKDMPVVYLLTIPSESAASSLTPNISGVSMEISPDAYAAAMKEIFPDAKRVGLLYDPRHAAAYAAEAAKSARAAGLDLVALQVRNPSDIPLSLQELGSAIDIFWMLPNPTVFTEETVELMLLYSFQHKVPIFSFSRKYVAMGAVASLDVDPYDMGVQAGEIVKALSAGRTGFRRVYARTARLTINKNVAAKMGLRIRTDKLKGVSYVE